MTASIIFHLLACLAYAILGLIIWRPMLALNNNNYAGAGNIDQPSSRVFKSCPINSLGHTCLIIALFLHGFGLYNAIIVKSGLHLGWAIAFSAAIWLGMIIFG